MDIKIFQIMSERDVRNLRFKDLDDMRKIQGSDEVNADIYQEVFSGNVDVKDLEDVYRKFNQEMHPLFRGRKMAPSDVLVADGEPYYCQKENFEKIEFDDSKAHKPDDLLKVVYVEPNRRPFISEIENTLEAEQKAVGGLIELIGNGDGTFIVGNDESKLIGMEGNRILESGSVIAGPFFVIGDDGEDFRSLTDEETEKYMNKFAEPQQISRQQVEADMGFIVMSF